MQLKYTLFLLLFIQIFVAMKEKENNKGLIERSLSKLQVGIIFIDR